MSCSKTKSRGRHCKWRSGKKLTGAGLRGQSAGQTALCTVGKTGTGLTYRGYDISELAEGATFEEVAHLILYGELPNKKQLDAYKAKLKKLRVSAEVRERRAGENSEDGASDGRHAHRLLVSRQRRARSGLQPAAGRGGQVAVDAPRHHQLLVPLQSRWRAHRNGNQRGFARRALPAPASRQEPERTGPARDGCVADPLRRARVQRVHLHRARLCFHAVRHALVRNGRDRVVARPTAWRRKRSSDGHDREIQLSQRRRTRASRGCWSAKTRSWDSVTPSTPRPILATQSSSRGRRSSRNL